MNIHLPSTWFSQWWKYMNNHKTSFFTNGRLWKSSFWGSGKWKSKRNKNKFPLPSVLTKWSNYRFIEDLPCIINSKLNIRNTLIRKWKKMDFQWRRQIFMAFDMQRYKWKSIMLRDLKIAYSATHFCFWSSFFNISNIFFLKKIFY